MNNFGIKSQGDEEDCAYVITEKEDGVCGYIHISQMFLGFIIGKKGVSKKRLEEDTNTIVTIPRGDDSCVNVSGEDRDSVVAALNKLLSMVDTVRQKTIFTHFLSIKISTETITNSFLKFKESVLVACGNDSGIEEIAFQREYKLHLTLCILVLGDQREIDSMINLGTQFQKDNGYLFLTPLSLNVCGLQCMNDNPTEARMLYAKISSNDDKERLQSIADKIVDYLIMKKVILQREYDKVILHMTLMNVSFFLSKRLDFNRAMQRKPPKTIDCSNIMDKFSDWDFGAVVVDEILLSRRKIQDVGSYYKSMGSFKFGGSLSL